MANNIGEFAALSREDQFAEAGRIAGVPPAVFDGMWRTESGRGANMLSTAGAEGHFQIMPKTRAVMEKRFGSTIDPYNFGQSLFTAAHLMKENIGRFKNVPDALRAFNGGWDPKRWANAETAGYAGKVLGDDLTPSVADDGSTAAALAAGPLLVSRSSAADLWDTPFRAAERATKPAKPNARAEGAAALIASLSAPLEAPTAALFGAASAANATADAKRADDKANTGLLDSARAAAFHEPINATLRYIMRDEEPADPNFVADEKLLKGYSASEQKDLRNAQSQKEFDRIAFDIGYGREQDEIAFRNGTAFGLGASLIAELPAAIVTGGIASTGFRLAGLGAFRLAAEGNRAGALASLAAEGIVGNVATTAALDMLGERQGVSAYAMAAAGGLLNPILGGRATGRVAAAAEEARTAQRIVAQAAAKEQAIMEQAAARLGPDATPAELRKMMDTVEAEGIRAEIASSREAIPEARKLNVGDEADLLDPGAAPKQAGDAAAESAAAVEAIPPSQLKPKWEDPAFHDARAAALETRTDWQAGIEKTLDGEVRAADLMSLPKGVTVTKAARESVTLRQPIADLEELAAKYLGPDARVVIGTGNVNPNADGAVMSFGNTHVIGLKSGNMPAKSAHTAWHELGHAIYHQHAPEAPVELMARVDKAYDNFLAGIKARNPAAWEDRWAITSPNTQANDIPLNGYTLSKDEWMAEQFVKHLQSAAMSGQLAEKLSARLIDRVTNAVKQVIQYVRGLVDKGYLKSNKEADEFFHRVMEGGFNKRVKSEEFLAPELRLPSLDEAASFSQDALPPALVKEVNDFMTDPVALRYGLDRLPMATPAERAEAKQVLALYKKAESPEYAVDKKRLSSLLNKSDTFSATSNLMLRSNNPVVRMVAIELLENGGGAAGRRSTASIAKYMNERQIIGNSIVELNQAFDGWAKTQGLSRVDEALRGRGREQFNRLVAEEIEQRRYPQGQTDLGASVREAADSLEAAFERARILQVDAKTAGWAALPESSRGYMPHRISSHRYRELTLVQKRALHAELTDQFVTVSQYDPTFADKLASKYLDRVEQRALGGFDAPMGMHQTGAADVIKEALEQMELTRPEIDAMMKRHVAGAAAHTKKRLNIDLRKQITAEDGSSFRLLDLYETNALSLLRGQAQTVSGYVALARHGVMGKPGLAIMRRAMGYGGDGQQALAREVNAFDQVSSEFLGQPFGESNKWVDRATQFNSISSLGGMGFNQLGEQINVAATLGVQAAAKNVAGFGRLRAEVSKLAKGQRVENPLLESIETMGGAEFGMDPFKMVFPLDNPDLFRNSMGQETLNVADRLLRGGIHLQGKLSLWRTINAVQVRGVAEQIVLKTAKALREGAGDYHLRDMGIDDAVLERIRKDMPNIVRWENGKVKSFDITKATDKDAANQLIQGIHRGASQMIQGTFIGETGKYVHNSWLRMMVQFKTFSITAIDKQWNRQVGNRGMIGAAMLTMAAMSVAAPLHMARVYAQAQGRADKEEFLAKGLSFGAVARATTNYIATSGLAGDFIDLATTAAGMGESTGGRAGVAQGFIGTAVAPAAGKVDKLWGALQNTKEGTDPHALIKELPFARLPWLIPAINSLND